jgi:hypothetical protein
MARIILGSYMFRYPLGGMLSSVMQYMLGFKNLGHDVFFVEKCWGDNECYDPTTKIFSNNFSYGLNSISPLFSKFGFQDHWCFVDSRENYYGLTKQAVEVVFKTADLFIDLGAHGSWASECSQIPITVKIDGEPGFTQIKWTNNKLAGQEVPAYNRYFTYGMNIGKAGNPAPTAGIHWEYLFHPVDTELFTKKSGQAIAYSTVMNWQSHKPIQYNGKMFGQKDIEFPKFLNLPRLVNQKLEIAVSGNAPFELLVENGWSISDAQEISRTFQSYQDYIASSRGEFSVCKNIFIENKTAWFSDKSAAYLASGKPVVVQDTGFGNYLPTGEGLFAVKNVEDAKAAIDTIERNYSKHCERAWEIANEYLDSKKVMKSFLDEIGI